MYRFALLLALLAPAALFAQEAASPPPLPAEGELPPAEDQLEPEVTITQQGNNVIEEYRVAGQLRMVKITPAGGVPYYLIDTDGDGLLETRSDGLQDPSTFQWTLFRW